MNKYKRNMRGELKFKWAKNGGGAGIRTPDSADMSRML